MDLLHTAHVPQGDGPFATVVTLHGWGASAHDLLGLAPLLQGGRVLMLCPQGRTEVPIGSGVRGYGWFPLRPGSPPDPAEFERAAEELRTFLDQAEGRYPIAPGKIVVAGFSQGGLMAYDLALRDPAHFAGLAALSSWLPEPVTARFPKVAAHEGFPVLVIHGTEDSMLPVERARESRELLRPLGVTITYREFAMAHEIRPEALRLIDRWLSDRVFGAATPSSSHA